MLVKICGITNKQAAYVATQAGADFIGFVFAESKRKISPIQARKITSYLPPSTKKIGVFVDETVETIQNIADTVGLDMVQLHGDEPPEIISELAYPVIKAIPAKIEQLQSVQKYDDADYILIDSPYGKYRGGNGTTFDWDTLRNLPIDSSKLILAGGLHPDNVQEAIQHVSPIGVDVSSGVETNGRKDSDKIIEFIKKAKHVKEIERMNKR